MSDIQAQEPGNPGLFIAQFLLLFQMITVYPLLVYIIRVQFMDFFYSNSYPSYVALASQPLSWGWARLTSVGTTTSSGPLPSRVRVAAEPYT